MLQRRADGVPLRSRALGDGRYVPPVPALRRDARGDQPRDVGKCEVDAWCAAASLLR